MPDAPNQTTRWPSYCCQRCGECIGWMGRAIDDPLRWLLGPGVTIHQCGLPRLPRIRVDDTLVDYIARSILATWTDSIESDWSDPLVRDNRRIEERAAVRAVREWESVHGKI